MRRSNAGILVRYLARYWFAVPVGKNGIPVGKFITGFCLFIFLVDRTQGNLGCRESRVHYLGIRDIP